MVNQQQEFKLKQQYDCPIRGDLIDSLERYLNYGIPPGGFLTAVLCNDLFKALGAADDENRANIFNIAAYIYNCLPVSSYGDDETVSEWTDSRRRLRNKEDGG